MEIVVSNLTIQILENAPKEVQIKFLLWRKQVKLFGLEAVQQIPSFHDEPMKGKRPGQRCIRLNKKWRGIYQQYCDGILKFTFWRAQPMITDFEFNNADQLLLDRQTETITFADALKAHRLCEEWTQEEAAQRLGITKQMFIAYETGKRIPTPKKAYEMAEILELFPKMAVLLAVNDKLKASQLPSQIQLTIQAKTTC